MSEMIKVEVKAGYDQDAGVWFVEESNLPGLSAEAETLEKLAKKLPAMIEDLLQDNCVDGDHGGEIVPIELIAHQSLKATIPAAA